MFLSEQLFQQFSAMKSMRVWFDVGSVESGKVLVSPREVDRGSRQAGGSGQKEVVWLYIPMNESECVYGIYRQYCLRYVEPGNGRMEE